MITDTKSGQTNYCQNCEDQARRIEGLQSECNEQARLNGMGSEHESRLLARIEELEQQNTLLSGVFSREEELKKTIEQLEQRVKILVKCLNALNCTASQIGLMHVERYGFSPLPESKL